MRKHNGIFSRRSPSFDLLEERSLLSGGSPGFPWPGQYSASLPLAVFRSEPMVFVGSSSIDILWSQGGGAAAGDQPGFSSPATEWQEQAGETPSYMSGGGSPFQSGTPGAAASNLGIQVNTATGSGALVPALAKSPAAVTEPALGVPIPLNTQSTTVSSAREAGQEIGNTGQIGLAAPSPPAQLLALLDGSIFGTQRQVSPGVAASGGEPAAGIERGRDAHGGKPNPGLDVRSRAPLLTTIDVSATAHDGNPDEWPLPGAVDLLASALPFDRASLARAIDQCFDQLETLSSGDRVGHRSASLVLYSLAMVSTFAALDVVRRRRRQERVSKEVRGRDPLAMTDTIGFPELPVSWSSRLS